MRRQGLQGISPRQFTPITTVSNASSAVPADLVNRKWDTGQLDRIWTSDITYLATGEGWLYLCGIRDGCSRRVIGWAMADHMRADLVEQALEMAVAFRTTDSGETVFHADRGSQYTSDQIAEYATENGLKCSVGRTGVCWDNAQQESFWASLKVEFYNRRPWATRAEAMAAVGDWIERVYNRRRRHSALGMLTPVQFEQLQLSSPVLPGLGPQVGFRERIGEIVSKFRGKYTPEFRDAAVREVVNNSRPIVDVARELGLVEQTLRNWVAAHRERLGGDAQELTVSERAKLKQLEKEVRELRMENEFLGKATAFFAKKSQ
jgi:transposase-like protein